MKTRVMSIVSQVSKKERTVYAIVVMVLLVAYVMCDLRLQSGYRALEKERHEEIVAGDSLRSEILRADLQENTLTSLEHILPLAENMGLGFFEPANKVILKNDNGGVK